MGVSPTILSLFPSTANVSFQASSNQSSLVPDPQLSAEHQRSVTRSSTSSTRPTTRPWSAMAFRSPLLAPRARENKVCLFLTPPMRPDTYQWVALSQPTSNATGGVETITKSFSTFSVAIASLLSLTSCRRLEALAHSTYKQRIPPPTIVFNRPSLYGAQ